MEVMASFFVHAVLLILPLCVVYFALFGKCIYVLVGNFG